MWCRRQAAALVLPLLLAGWLTGESSEALTTFGKSNTPAPNYPPPPTRPPAKMCQKQTDCLGIKNTSCVRTAIDSALRCLCGDNMAPLNGLCDPNTFKGLHHQCLQSLDCGEGLICMGPTQNSDASVSQRQGSYERVCVCDEENGFVEKDFGCNAAATATSMTGAILILLAMILM